MEQIIIQVKDKDKAKALYELLRALDFVDSIKSSQTEPAVINSTIDNVSDEFFSMAGIWQDRDVTTDSIRQKAWPQKNP